MFDWGSKSLLLSSYTNHKQMCSKFHYEYSIRFILVPLLMTMEIYILT